MMAKQNVYVVELDQALASAEARSRGTKMEDLKAVLESKLGISQEAYSRLNDEEKMAQIEQAMAKVREEVIKDGQPRSFFLAMPDGQTKSYSFVPAEADTPDHTALNTEHLPEPGSDPLVNYFANGEQVTDNAVKKDLAQASGLEKEDLGDALMAEMDITKEEFERLDEAAKAEKLEKAMESLREKVISSGKPKTFTLTTEDGQKKTITFSPAGLDKEADKFPDGDPQMNYYVNGEQTTKDGFWNEVLAIAKVTAMREAARGIIHSPGKLKRSVDQAIEQGLR